MTPRQIAALAVRVLALYVLFDAIKMMSSLIYFYYAGAYGIGSTLPTGSMNLMQTKAMSVLAQFLLLAGFALFLSLFADGLAALMVKNDVQATPVERVSGIEIQTIAFSVIGLFAAFQALSQLFSHLLSLFYASRLGSPDFAPGELGAILGSLIMLILGSYFIFGARSFVKFVRSARDIGRDPNFVDEP